MENDTTQHPAQNKNHHTTPYPMQCNFSIHSALYDALKKFGKSNGLNQTEAGRLILNHFLVLGERDHRVATQLATPKQNVVTKPGLGRIRSLGISVSVECSLALVAKANVTPNPAPTVKKPMCDYNDVARAILEAVLLSSADRKLVIVRSCDLARTPRINRAAISIHASDRVLQLLDTLFKGKKINRSMYITLLLEDAVSGTNKAPRYLALPDKPLRCTSRAVADLG